MTISPSSSFHIPLSHIAALDQRYSMTATPGSGTGWGTGATDSYTYDPDLDYLTEVDYAVGTDESWTYDAAGNRADSGYTYNNLNMMSASPGHSYEHDILGNRTYRNPSSYTAWRYVWDEAGRLAKAAGPSSGATYTYRADGMRVRKVDGLTLAWIDSEESASGFYDEIQSVNNDTWRYRYDGQMCFGEDLTKITGAPGNPVATMTGTSYALGARGIDMLRPFEVENTSGYPRTYGVAQLPIYDGHGNMKCTLSPTGSSPYCVIAHSRHYDAWGGLRPGSGNESGNPNTRYCANLGHKQDDESDLIYMRARYYETGTGRFISEDAARDGANWYVYCGNEPVCNGDPSGTVTIADILVYAAGLAALLIGALYLGIGFCFNRAAADCASAALRSAESARWFNDSGLSIADEIAKSEAFLHDLYKAAERGQAMQARRAFSRAAKWGAGGVGALLAYELIIKAFLLQLDIEGTGLDIVDTVFGGS